MEDGANTVQRDADARTRTFTDIRAQSYQEGLNVGPRNAGTYWHLEDGPQRCLVFRLHDQIVSPDDIVNKPCRD